MNPKLKRTIADIAKSKAKIAAEQARLRNLERQKTDQENEEIVALFRREKLSEDEFTALVRGHRENESRPDTPVVQESPDMEGTGDEEE